MFFNSFLFVGFWICVLLELLLERVTCRNIHLRNALLLTASYVFYGWFNIGFLLILIFVTLVNFYGANMLFRRKSKTVLGWTVVLSLLPLIFFKYSLFICKSFASLLNFELDFELLNGLLLPVGISFFTFQALSYSIDVYRGKIETQASMPDFFLFVSFFPTILSGPIEKARNLLPQIRQYFFPTGSDLIQGGCVFIWGLFKKMVIADRLAQYVNLMYATKGGASGATLALAAAFYSIQIYCDFSGYSDMALGVAKSLGFNVTKNFRQPYFSRTFKEFWRKWHIALTTWFTEYVYFSLGGSKVKTKARWIFNISTIFILSGIWHGAAWNFLIWGALHAIYYLTEHFLGLQRKEIKWNWFTSCLMGCVVFVLATIAWIFFRVETFGDAAYIIGKIFTNPIGGINVGMSSFTFAATLGMLAIFIGYEICVRKGWLNFDADVSKGVLVRNIFAVVPMLLLLGMFGISSDNFVYFKF